MHAHEVECSTHHQPTKVQAEILFMQHNYDQRLGHTQLHTNNEDTQKHRTVVMGDTSKI